MWKKYRAEVSLFPLRLPLSCAEVIFCFQIIFNYKFCFNYSFYFQDIYSATQCNYFKEQFCRAGFGILNVIDANFFLGTNAL